MLFASRHYPSQTVILFGNQLRSGCIVRLCKFDFCLAICMSVVHLFVVAVQWPICTILTTPFILFLNTYPFSKSLWSRNLQFTQIYKIVGEYIYGNVGHWKSLKHFVLISLLITSLRAMCKWIVAERKKINSTCNSTLLFKSHTGQVG